MIDLGINLFQEIAALGGGGGGYSITNSLRFNDNDSAYLSRTPSVAGNRKTWTWSGWVKRGNLGSLQMLFAASNESTTQGYISLGPDDSFGYFDYVSTSNVNVKTNALLRDVSGWYHLVVVFDTTQATGSDRVKIYINGTEQAVTYTLTPSLNYEGSINTTGAHGIGREEYGNTYYFDGYLAETNFIDGQALTADDFGEISETTGEWSPKAYAGTYGTNGFYLPFDGNANDSSGNGNNWTENNIASTDYMIDTPTNNFSTLNPLALGADATLSEGNLEVAYGASSTRSTTTATFGVSSGKWYWEVSSNINGSEVIGITNTSNYPQLYPGFTPGGWGYYSDNGNKFIEGSASSYGDSWVDGDIISFALDMDAGTLVAYKNGVSQGTMVSGLTGNIFPAIGDGNGAVTTNNTYNFGADSSFAGNKTGQGNTDVNGKGDFYYQPPFGYLALCEDNLTLDPFVATGGTETTITDGDFEYKVHTFTSSGTFEVTSGYKKVEYLVVAGGGSGGDGFNGGGGGGGAGGYRSSVFGESSGGGAPAEPKLAVSAGSYAVTVGAGGAGGSRNNGSNSSFDTIVSIGGGSGGTATVDGSLGGSGGGGSGSTFDSSNGGAGTAGQGYSGGNARSGTADYQRASGGGGGAGEAGDNGVTFKSGDGGDGLESSISGSATFYAGGGGGGVRSGNDINPGVGGLGGGGDGGSNDPATPATAGEPNTGGGGSAARLLSEITAGGSGIVIVRYLI